MLKKAFVTVIMCFLTFSALSCPNAVATDDINFCASFKSVAKCYCASRLPTGMCEDMLQLAYRMMAVYGSIENGCKAQRYTSAEDCMDNWNCYLKGGVDSRNRVCNTNGRACI